MLFSPQDSFASICFKSTSDLLVACPGANVVSGRHTMPDYSYILFGKSPAQLRLIGARGGRAYGRNQRARRALVSTPAKALPPRPAPRQTTADAIAGLDQQFPWLRGAEKRHSNHFRT